jgi:predicted DNA-binding transcriptional regulator AlpA
VTNAKSLHRNFAHNPGNIVGQLATRRLTFSVHEVCLLLGVSRSFLYERWSAGDGPDWIKAGRRRLVSAASLSAWIRVLEARGHE